LTAADSPQCRIDRCNEVVPPALAAAALCLDHFLSEAFVRAELALEKCQRGESLDRTTLDWLIGDVQTTLNAVSEMARKRDLAQQSRILELLLCVANLNEYVAHHSVHSPHRN
jgi:hypothetical protein